MAPQADQTIKLRASLCIVLLVSCSAQPGPVIGPISTFSGIASGWQDLSILGGPALGISSDLLQVLSQMALSVFGMDISGVTSVLGALAGGALGRSASGLVGTALAPPLPPLPKHHKLAPWASKYDNFLRLLADKWTGALVKAQFSPGLQGFLGLLGLQDEQEALIKWLCIIYPWDALVPEVIREVRDSYCVKALPSAAVARIVGSGPGPKLPLGGPKGPLPIGMPGPMLG